MKKSYTKQVSRSKFTLVLLSASLGALLTLSGCSSKNESNVKIAKLISDNKPSKSEKDYYESANKNILKSRYEAAEKELEELISVYPIGLYKQQALLDLLYIKLKQEKYEEADAIALDFIRRYPTHENIDYALYAKGVSTMNSSLGALTQLTSLKSAHRDVSPMRGSVSSFENLIKYFPNSKYSPDAAKRLHFIYNQFADNEIFIARFNMKRKAYFAAIERAKVVFYSFPQSKATPEAIATLAYAYEQIGANDLSAKYKQLLRLNFPHLISGEEVHYLDAVGHRSIVNRLTLGIVN